MAIQVGLEDLRTGGPARVRSAVRNLHAGVMLVLKHRLAELSPEGSDEALIKQKIMPHRDNDGKVRLVGRGAKTVDVQGIKERLLALGVEVDWRRLEHLSRERNKIEHYDADISADALRGIASDVLVVVRDFVVRELHFDPLLLFGDDVWQGLLENGQVFDAERRYCLEALRQIEWPSSSMAASVELLPCLQCLSRLLLPDAPGAVETISLRCRSCGAAMTFDEFAESALRARYPDEDESGRRLEVDPLAACPGCDRYTYLVADGECAACCYQPPHTHCLRCEEELDLDEAEDGICGYCWHVTHKDD